MTNKVNKMIRKYLKILMYLFILFWLMSQTLYAQVFELQNGFKLYDARIEVNVSKIDVMVQQKLFY